MSTFAIFRARSGLTAIGHIPSGRFAQVRFHPCERGWQISSVSPIEVA